MSETSDFKSVFTNSKSRDEFYLFLKNIFHLYPEDRFQQLIGEACQKHDDDAGVYHDIEVGLPGIKPFLSELTMALPALRHQKAEMARETLELLDQSRTYQGYAEIGTTGRYISELRHAITIEEPWYLIHDVEPGFSPADIMERSQIPRLGTFVALDNYAPIPADKIADASLDLLTCYVGLHHIAADRLEPFVASLARVLRPGGVFVLRDHDVANPDLFAFVSLAHTVFNVGLGIKWEENSREIRLFQSIDAWIELLARHGFVHEGRRLLQEGDPTLNTLMAFTRK
jgi:hypothetical protein